MNVGSVRVPVIRGRHGPRTFSRPSRKLASTAVLKRGSNIMSTVASREVVEQVVDRDEGRVRRRVAAQAQEEEVVGSMRVEGRLGVEHEVGARRGRGLPIGVGRRRHDVLHDPPAVLGDVADGLAEAASDGQHRQFGRQVLVGRGCRRRRRRREWTDRNVADEERHRSARRGGEADAAPRRRRPGERAPATSAASTRRSSTSALDATSAEPGSSSDPLARALTATGTYVPSSTCMSETKSIKFIGVR